MAREVPNDYGDERTRYGVFTGALSDMTPGEAVTVGISILGETHILTAEKTGYGKVFIRVYDTDWGALVAEEYDITQEQNNVQTAAAAAVSTATDRYLRIRTDKFSQVDVQALRDPSN